MKILKKCLAMLICGVMISTALVGCSEKESPEESSEEKSLRDQLLDEFDVGNAYDRAGQGGKALTIYLNILDKMEENGMENDALYENVNAFIGHLYEDGELGEPDNKTASSYFEKAGNSYKLSVAIDYITGETEGIEKDLDKAIELLEELVADGYEEAETWLVIAKPIIVVDGDTVKETEKQTQKETQKPTQKPTTEKTTEKNTEEETTTTGDIPNVSGGSGATGIGKPEEGEGVGPSPDITIEPETRPTISTDRTTLKGMLGAYLKQASTGKIDKSLFHSNQQTYLSNLSTSSTTMKELGFINGYTYDVTSIMIFEPGIEMKWEVVMEAAFEKGYVPLLEEKAFHEGIDWMSYFDLGSVYYGCSAIGSIKVNGVAKSCNIDLMYVIEGGKYYVVDAKIEYKN